MNEDTEETRLRSIQDGGIELFVCGLDGSTALDGPSAIVTWKLSDDVCEKIAQDSRFDSEEVMIAIDCVSEYGMSRTTVKLRDKAAVVHFSRPGLHRIYAGITDSTNGLMQMYTFEGCKRAPDRLFLGSGLVQVEVSEEVFDDKPADFEYVNSWFNTPSRDSCQHAMRRIPAYSFFPLWVSAVHAGIFIVRLVWICILLLCGMRGINFKPLWSLDESVYTDKIDVGLRGSIFLPTWGGHKQYFLMLLSPAMLLPLFGLAQFLHAEDLSASAVAVGSYFVCGVVGILMCAVNLLFWTAVDLSQERRVKRKAKATERVVAENKFKKVVVPSNGIGEVTDAAALPTVKLHLARLKRDVCRIYRQ